MSDIYKERLYITPPPPKTTEMCNKNHQKWLSYQILGGKTVKNVQIDPQTTNNGYMVDKAKNDVSEGVLELGIKKFTFPQNILYIPILLPRGVHLE